ncbi:MAG: hypothetical protein ABS63_00185 [Microbacterium sp. SCN 70-27]|uniref:DedA family protein n=1 Tax=unclassified Microbacterium TaxID=2609290 RepID=UPI00086C4C69|nr:MULTISPECIES: VTT domain-containing protein [unclassified Microbacterium]MBN9223851.1 VTT domain-containing protein [Microbacterium sp.]ODT29297.1 MAG: hypothetical protein ABS63_00185 [Microbacterium sp. SCN 70-27]
MNVIDTLSGFGTFALILIALIVVVENGLLFPFLPGDSLVFAGAVLAAALGVHWAVPAVIAAVAALVGGEIGFVVGRRFGPRLFRPDARVLKERYLADTGRFFLRWGSLAIVLARFVPIVRTYVAPAAGMSGMPHVRFSAWNAASAVIWAGVLGAAGYLLGSIPWVAANIEWMMLAIVVVTIAPIVVIVLVRYRAGGQTAGTAAR